MSESVSERPAREVPPAVVPAVANSSHRLAADAAEAARVPPAVVPAIVNSSPDAAKQAADNIKQSFEATADRIVDASRKMQEPLLKQLRPARTYFFGGFEERPTFTADSPLDRVSEGVLTHGASFDTKNAELLSVLAKRMRQPGSRLTYLLRQKNGADFLSFYDSINAQVLDHASRLERHYASNPDLLAELRPHLEELRKMRVEEVGPEILPLKLEILLNRISRVAAARELAQTAEKLARQTIRQSIDVTKAPDWVGLHDSIAEVADSRLRTLLDAEHKPMDALLRTLDLHMTATGNETGWYSGRRTAPRRAAGILLHNPPATIAWAIARRTLPLFLDQEVDAEGNVPLAVATGHGAKFGRASVAQVASVLEDRHHAALENVLNAWNRGLQSSSSSGSETEGAIPPEPRPPASGSDEEQPLGKDSLASLVELLRNNPEARERIREVFASEGRPAGKPGQRGQQGKPGKGRGRGGRRR